MQPPYRTKASSNSRSFAGWYACGFARDEGGWCTNCFSHTGIREVAEKNMVAADDRMILPDKAEIDKIKACDGVFGIILMNYWTGGKEEDNLLHKDNGIPNVLETIRFINSCTGSFDHIAIGSDLDGFTQVPDDIKHIRFIGRLRDALINEFGMEAAEKIGYSNAVRVLSASWDE